MSRPVPSIPLVGCWALGSHPRSSVHAGFKPAITQLTNEITQLTQCQFLPSQNSVTRRRRCFFAFLAQAGNGNRVAPPLCLVES